ncbi:MAG: hypothetical protein ACETWM_08050 [Candidatus Lokiarchaeia archaeon]
MTKQMERKASRNEEASSIFSDHGYKVESYENFPVSMAWRIHRGERYDILDLIAYRATAVEKIREDRRTVSRLSRILLYQFVDSPSSPSGIELKKIFGVYTPYYRGKQVIIVADKFLVSGSRDESDVKIDSIEVVPVSDLSSVLEIRKDSVLKRAKRIFRPNKGEVLRKAYSRARKGLILTIVLIALLIPLILLNATGAVFQILLTVDSILIISTIIVSIIVHELGVAKFQKLLREELIAFQEPQEHFASLQHVSRTSKTYQKFPKQRIETDSAPQPFKIEPSPHELEIEKYVDPLSTEERNSSEFYAQRRDGLWDLAQNAYEEGDFENCAYHLKGAVSSAIKEIYVKLTGKAVFEPLPKITEYICEKTGLNHEGFQQFFERIKNPQKLTEAELSRLFEHAQKFLTDLQSASSAKTTSEADSVEKVAVRDQKELSKKDLQGSESVSAPRSKKSSKVSKKSGVRGKSKAAKKESVNEKSEKLSSEHKVLNSIGVGTEAEVTDCDSVIEEMCADDNIKNALKKLFDSRGAKVVSPAFLVVTQSPEVVNIVELLKQNYPEVPIGTYERAVNGKAQILVSRDGGITSKIDYESPRQLKKLIKDSFRDKKLKQSKPSGSIDDFIEFLEE